MRVAAQVPSTSVGARKPAIVMSLIVLSFLVGVGFILFGLLLLILAVPPAISGLATFIGLAMLATGVLGVVTGYGLARRKGFAKWTGTVSDAGFIVLGLVFGVRLNSWVAALGILGVVLGAASIYYLFLSGPKTKNGDGSGAG